MKNKYLYLIIAIALSSCGINNFSTSNVYEDDLYYNPNEKPLSVKEVEKNLAIYSTNDINNSTIKDNSYTNKAKKIINKNREDYPDVTNKELNELEIASVSLRRNPKTGASDTIIEIINKGFWINGFKGTNYNLEEAMKTIEKFPNGFGYYGNASEIANNLAYNSNWNVFTREGYYWWFPVYGNVSSIEYPRLRQINAWNYGYFDSWGYAYNYRNYHPYYGFTHRSLFYDSFFGFDSFYGNYYDYGYGYGYPYYYGYGFYRPYRFYHTGYNRKQSLLRDRGRTYGRQTRRTTRLSPNGRTYQRVTRSNSNVRRRSFNRSNSPKTNTNYKRKKINYNTNQNTTRPSYNNYNSKKSNTYKKSGSSNNNRSRSHSKSRPRRR